MEYLDDKSKCMCELPFLQYFIKGLLQFVVEAHRDLVQVYSESRQGKNPQVICSRSVILVTNN